MATLRNVVHALNNAARKGSFQKATDLGSGYKACATKNGMSSGDTLAMCFKTPTDCKIRFGYSMEAKAEAHLDLLEDCDWSGGQTGTFNTIIAKNRYNQRTSHLYVDRDMTGTTGLWAQSGTVKVNPSGLSGSLLCRDYVFGGDFYSADRYIEKDFILKTGALYALRFIAGAETNAGHVVAEWTEEEL